MIFLNELQFLMLLKSVLQQYEDMTAIHRLFIPELTWLLKNAGNEKPFVSKLEDYLIKLREHGEDCIGGKGAPMEHLSGQSPLCSMRFPFSGSNLRVLFTYQDGTVYILTAFYERAGHKNTEYSKHIPVAKQRLDELKKEG